MKKTLLIVILVFAAFLLSAGAFALWGYFSSFNLEKNKISFPDSGIPSEAKGLKIAQLSDLHIGGSERNERLAKEAVQWSNEQNPDLVFISGDFVNNTAGIERCIEVLKPLKAEIGIYAVLGNWDYDPGTDTNLLKERLTEIGVHILVNQSVKIEDKNIYIVGIDKDGFKPSYPAEGTAFKDVPEGAFTLAIAHWPDIIENLKNFSKKPDYIFTGHTHGGQIVFPFYGPYYVSSKISREFGRKHAEGIFSENNMKIYVSRGTGTTPDLPQRFFSRPEVTIFEFGQ